mmetsp:Transcript_18369/g.34114  ORF Transcript_18369/g.34114 Transcript_18369/m.34114 type:complete len:236 (-) Transcript_18369:474-1181(-)
MTSMVTFSSSRFFSRSSSSVGGRTSSSSSSRTTISPSSPSPSSSSRSSSRSSLGSELMLKSLKPLSSSLLLSSSPFSTLFCLFSYRIWYFFMFTWIFLACSLLVTPSSSQSCSSIFSSSRPSTLWCIMAGSYSGNPRLSNHATTSGIVHSSICLPLGSCLAVSKRSFLSFSSRSWNRAFSVCLIIFSFSASCSFKNLISSSLSKNFLLSMPKSASSSLAMKGGLSHLVCLSILLT